jgi:hypothetical protein
MIDSHDRAFDVRELSDDELGAMLRQAFAFPSTPELTTGVIDRIEATSTGQARIWRWPRLSRGLVLAVLALAVAGAVAAAAILGVPGIRIVTVDEMQRPTPAASASPSDLRRMSAALGLGVALSLDEVRELVGMPVVPPADPELGPPDALYLDRGLAGGMVSMVWSARPGLPAAGTTGVGLLVSQFDGQVNSAGFEKLVDQEVRVQPVVIAGADGWWLEGATHVFLRRSAAGEESHPVVPTRLAGDTLLWERDGLTFRLEGSVGRERAIAIAESISGNESDADGVVPS